MLIHHLTRFRRILRCPNWLCFAAFLSWNVFKPNIGSILSTCFSINFRLNFVCPENFNFCLYWHDNLTVLQEGAPHDGQDVVAVEVGGAVVKVKAAMSQYLLRSLMLIWRSIIQKQCKLIEISYPDLCPPVAFLNAARQFSVFLLLCMEGKPLLKLVLSWFMGHLLPFLLISACYLD